MTDELRQEMAALADIAGRHDAQYEFIEGFHYPDGIRMAVNFTVDFDSMLYRRVLNEPTMQLAMGEFGGRVGIWRLIELFDSHQVKATFFTPGRAAELYPQALRALVRSGHELADHMWEHRVAKEPELARDHLLKTIAALERISGRRPVGTRSSQDPALLCEQGYLYVSEGCAGHLPYYVTDRNGENRLLELPFHYAIDDAQFYTFGWLGSSNPAQRITDPDRVFDMWWAAFQQQYDESGYLNICTHPYVSGHALRIAMLDRLIAKMKTLPGVWFPTCEEVTRYCLANFPAKAGRA